MYLELLLLASTYFQTGWSKFVVGRLREGQYEYSRLNGWMTPARAKHRCDRDSKCGGFTYKGYIKQDQPFEIFFFHLILNFESERDAWNWVTYKPDERDYVHFHGNTFRGIKVIPKLRLTCSTAAQTKCLRMRGKCAGVLTEEETGHLSLFSEINMDNLVEDEKFSISVKLEFPYTGMRGISGKDDYENIDKCCPKTDIKGGKWSKLVKDFMEIDSIERISCDVSKEEFEKRFIRRSKPVVVTGCSANWTAQADWTIEGLLARNGGNNQWKTNFVQSSGQVEDTENQGKLKKGRDILKMMHDNTTIRIFDPLAEHEHANKRKRGFKDVTDKLELKDDYSTPAMFGEDMFKECGLLTDYQWTLLSNSNTGTDLHIDPLFANSWNTVLYGHKLWAILPPDMEPEPIQCDFKCSGSKDEISPLSWFLHLLPQLASRRWYGKSVTLLVQGPGDTLFVPSRSGHAVLNLDTSLAVTENIFTVESLLELPHKLLLGTHLFPDMDEDPRERREERMWKCLTRGRLGRKDRQIMADMVGQVEGQLGKYPRTCTATNYGREFLRKFDEESGKPLDVEGIRQKKE